jgi:hypothetical protein
MLRKTKEYHGEFATYPSRAQLETNFWNGDLLTGSQYWKPRAGNSELVVPGLQSVNSANSAQGAGGVGI